MHLRPLL